MDAYGTPVGEPAASMHEKVEPRYGFRTRLEASPGVAQNLHDDSSLVVRPNRQYLAEQAYMRALETVRTASTPGAWKRLLRSAKNLKESVALRAMGQGPSRTSRPGATPALPGGKPNHQLRDP